MSLNNIKVNNSTVIGVDNEPTVGSDNLVKSSGIFNKILDSFYNLNTGTIKIQEWEQYKYIDLNGNIVSHTSSVLAITPLISLKSAYGKIKVKAESWSYGSSRDYAFYDSNKEYIPTSSQKYPWTKEIEIPNNAAYARFATINDNSDFSQDYIELHITERIDNIESIHNKAIQSEGYTFTASTPIDLNDLKENSFRYLNGSGILNKPDGSSTDLYILSAIGQEGQYPVYEQILFDITKGKMYSRTFVASEWSDWTLFYNSYNINPILSKGYTFTTDTPVDLNDLKENSFRYLNGSGILNKPDGSSTNLYILSAIGQEGQYPVYEQVLFDITNGKIYTRDYVSTEWHDWVLFYDNQEPEQNYDIHVGSGQDYTSLTQAVVAANGLYLSTGKMYNVIVHPGTYDLISEGALNYYNGYGLKLYCNIIGSQGANVVARPETLYENFSPFYVTNVFSAKIENITIEIENCRYCVHDELGAYSGTVENPNYRLYKNVHFINHGWTVEHSVEHDITRCIGCGLGGYSLIEVADCVFESDDDRYTLIDAHSSFGDFQSSPSKFIIHGCYFKNQTVSGTSHGDTIAYKNEMYIYNNSMPSEPFITNGYEANITMIKWNNEIRQS